MCGGQGDTDSPSGGGGRARRGTEPPGTGCIACLLRLSVREASAPAAAPVGTAGPPTAQTRVAGRGRAAWSVTGVFCAARFVLAVGSAVFDAMFNGGMATTSTEIELPDVEPAAFLALLR